MNFKKIIFIFSFGIFFLLVIPVKVDATELKICEYKEYVNGAKEPTMKWGCFGDYYTTNKKCNEEIYDGTNCQSALKEFLAGQAAAQAQQEAEQKAAEAADKAAQKAYEDSQAASKAQAEAAKKAAEEEALKAAELTCNCYAVNPKFECRDNFKTVSEAIDYCVSCGLPPPNPGADCPLGTKENGPFTCTCGKGNETKCASYDTIAKLNSECPNTCGKGNGVCPVVGVGDTMEKLRAEAKKLNPANFAIGTSGVIQIIGTLVGFLMYPIGMLTMVMYIWAGFLWMTAQGNAENVEKSKNILIWTTLGVVVTLASYLIVKLVFTEIL